MTTPAKKPGIFKDPWRSVPEPEPQAPLPLVESAKPVPNTPDELEEDIADPKYSTIAVKGYGGITVDGVSTALNAASQILKFCVEKRHIIEPTLLNYGIVVCKMTPGKLTTKFYIKRADGWTLAIPDATNRDNGCLQLIQALLEVQTDPAMKREMQLYHIRPYKM
jgi:hypothetical protein